MDTFERYANATMNACNFLLDIKVLRHPKGSHGMKLPRPAVMAWYLREWAKKNAKDRRAGRAKKLATRLMQADRAHTRSMRCW